MNDDLLLVSKTPLPALESSMKTVAEDSSVTVAEQVAERVARKALVEALLICIRYADSSADTEQAHAALALAAKLP